MVGDDWSMRMRKVNPHREMRVKFKNQPATSLETACLDEPFPRTVMDLPHEVLDLLSHDQVGWPFEFLLD